MIDPTLDLPVSTQCQLLGLARSTYYYESTTTESDLNLALMQEINRLYLAHSENGWRMMTKVHRRGGHEVNRKRVQRFMQLMGLRSLCPQPKTTTPNKAHPVYPYLLRGLRVTHPNHVWCSDLTYIPFKKGFLYLVAIMDWHSRKVLTLSTRDLERPLVGRHQRRSSTSTYNQFNKRVLLPPVELAPYMSNDFRELCDVNGILQSVGRTGSCHDNAVAESLWTTMKREFVHRYRFASRSDARRAITGWINRYNAVRQHSSVNGMTPIEWELEFVRRQVQAA